MARRKVRPGPLEARSAAILRAIIEEYVATAQPVGSVALVEKYALSISPATVRNVMAELESAELLGHPHTSAGRVPTDRGYRFYVESIAGLGRPGARRAAHDPPPVRPGRVRQRAVVPPGSRHAGLGHARGRHRHTGQAAHLPRPPRGHPGHRGALREPRPGHGRWSGPAGPPEPGARVHAGRARRDRPPAGRACSWVAATARGGRGPCRTAGAARHRRCGLHAGHRAHQPPHARVRLGRRRGGLQRGPAQRHGRAGVRSLGAAAPRLRGAAGPRLPGRPRGAPLRLGRRDASSSAARTSTRR